MANISRRNFMKVAAGAAGIAGLGLLNGCSKTEAPASSAAASAAGSAAEGTTPAAAAPATDKLYTASINPQLDESEFRSNTKELTTLFSPLTIGSMEISNRMVKSAAGSATYLAGLTDELLTYYVNLAKGGVALIYVETIAALEIPEGGSYDADTLAFGQKLVDECHKYGAKMGYQMSGFGMGENDMTIDDIHAKQAHFVEIAKGLQQMGFDCVELNCAGFNMPAHFLSRFHNTRTDEYGIGSIENRARFITEIIEGVKKECGPDFNMQILINCIEENDNISNNPTMMTLDSAVTTPHTLAMTMEEGIAAAKLFEQAGCDSMHLRLGPLGHHVAQFGADLYFILNGIEGCTGFGTQYDVSKNWQGMLIGNTSGCGIGLNVAAEYKKALSIPCGVVTYNDPAHAPDFFEQALEDGKADFFLMTRPLTVDMEYVNKLKEGRIDEIAPCTRCLHCHIGSNEANAQMAYCRVNALTQRVMREGGPTTYELEPAATPKKVMVIGGGPAGMEAARIAAARGHNVTLYEKRGALGFMLDFAASVKGPHENLADLKNYLIRQLELNGVEVKTGTEVTQELIHSEAPDAVILAAGGLRDTLTVDGDGIDQFSVGDGSAPGVERDNFMFTEMGDNVIVYGSNAQAFDAALWLTVHKKNVTIVTPNPASEFDMQQSQHAMRMMTTALYALGVKSYPQSAIKTVSGNVATLTLDSGVEMSIKCDAIVNGADMLPNTSLVDGIDCKEVYTIGDCANPFNIALAIRGGNDAGRAV